MTERPSPDDILATYERQAEGYAAHRATVLFERPWLDRLRAAMPGDRLLDVGCGPGVPLARAMAEAGCRVTGVDGAAAMVRLFRQNMPGHRAVVADMRTMALGERFDGILAFDSFFHLTPDDQHAALARFADHAAPGAALLFTSGPEAGEAYGTVEGEAVYHASLSPEEYRTALAALAFEVLGFWPEDPACDFHTLWLARMAR